MNLLSLKEEDSCFITPTQVGAPQAFYKTDIPAAWMTNIIMNNIMLVYEMNVNHIQEVLDKYPEVRKGFSLNVIK